MQKNDKNIDAVEEMLAHHEQTIEDLSVQLAKQWIVISNLETKILTLTKRFITMEQNSMPTPHVTKPPHY
ncbi:MAG: hypothetical protein GY761_10970 [Hyphomicrobiales bacterium]|nr:hypothetical protein [Hyphomicrobiales bacterium]